MMKMATGEGFPLRQGAGTGLDWFSVATKASGGGTPDLFCSPKYVGGSPGCPRGRGARPPPLWAAQDSSGPSPILCGLLLVQK